MRALSALQIQTGMGALMAVVGAVGVAVPRYVGASPGDGCSADDSAYATRMWALRETALGAILVAGRRSAHRRQLIGTTVGLALAEVAVGLRSPALTGRAQACAVVTAAVFAAAGTRALLLDR